MTCPSDLALESHLLGGAQGGVRSHVAGCTRCQERLARMEDLGREFRQYVMPATLPALERARRRPFWMLAPAGALAAAALVAIVAIRRPPADYEGVKGAALKLTVYTNGATQARALADGARIPATSALRFAVQAGAGCELWMVSIDGEGQISPLAGPLHVEGSRALPGGAVLDGKSGLERIYAVCSPEPVAKERIEAAVRASGARDLRTAEPLRGLPRGAIQATILLEKLP